MIQQQLLHSVIALVFVVIFPFFIFLRSFVRDSFSPEIILFNVRDDVNKWKLDERISCPKIFSFCLEVLLAFHRIFIIA